MKFWTTFEGSLVLSLISFDDFPNLNELLMKKGEDIPIELWKCLRKQRIEWLTKLYNMILKIKKMHDQKRVSTLSLV